MPKALKNLMVYNQCACTSSDTGRLNDNGCVRLADGASKHEGRAEVCIVNYWRTVCDDLWNDTDARVVCAQLEHCRLIQSLSLYLRI